MKHVTDKAFRIAVTLSLFAIFFCITDSVLAQEITVRGQVVSADNGDPLPGATVIIQGTQRGTSTNTEGNYELNNVPEDATLIFSFTGFNSLSVEVGDGTQLM